MRKVAASVLISECAFGAFAAPYSAALVSLGEQAYQWVGLR
jgi:hypothetical protein